MFFRGEAPAFALLSGFSRNFVDYLSLWTIFRGLLRTFVDALDAFNVFLSVGQQSAITAR